MPLAQITLLDGQPAEKKKALIAAVTEAVAGSLDLPAQQVRVILMEVPDSHWGVGGLSVRDMKG